MANHYILCKWAIAFAVCASTAEAADEYTEQETRAAGPYCMYSQSFPLNTHLRGVSPEVDKWWAILGPSFWHIHHYCYGKIAMNRSMKSGLTNQQRISLRERALREIKYVLANADKDFVLAPELYMTRGQLHKLLKRPTEAEKAFEKATEIKPDFWPPYYHWVEMLIEEKNESKAREVLTEALKKHPEAQPLKRLATMLKMKIPAPNPASPLPADGQSLPAEQQ